MVGDPTLLSRTILCSIVYVIDEVGKEQVVSGGVDSVPRRREFWILYVYCKHLARFGLLI
jgi:hypothetical protein